MSGHGLAASARRGEQRLVLVVNGLNGVNVRAREAERLLDYGFRSFKTYVLFRAGDVVDEFDVWLGEADAVPLVVDSDVTLMMPRKARKEMVVKIVVDGPIAAPVEKGAPGGQAGGERARRGDARMAAGGRRLGGQPLRLRTNRRRHRCADLGQGRLEASRGTRAEAHDAGRRMMRGRLITLEGGDGAGKTVQTGRLCAALEERGIETLATREPGGSAGAEEIRRLLVSGPVERWDPLTEAMLHAAARRDHLLHTIEPALGRGLWVVSDRFVDSMVVYQGYGQGADLAVLESLTALSLGDFRPDLTVMLGHPGGGRAQARGRAGAIQSLRAHGRGISRACARRFHRPRLRRCGALRGGGRGGGPRDRRPRDPGGRCRAPCLVR